MINLSQITVRIRDIQSFRGLLEVYEDLAAQKMQKIRDEIAKHREYTRVLVSMSGELEMDISNVIKKNSKQRADVLISSDKGLYGSVFDALAEQFFESVRNKNIDDYVVGGIGVEILNQCGLSSGFEVVNSDQASLVELWKKLGEYQEINIYYLRYDSLAKQSVDMIHISGDVLPRGDDSYEYDSKNKLKYLYEPSVIEVAEVFAKEVLTFLAEQTMKECDLAKHAARLMYLDSCVDRNNQNLQGTLKQKMILMKRLSNKRQNARMASYITRNAII